MKIENFQISTIDGNRIDKTKDNLKAMIKDWLPYMTDPDLVELQKYIVDMRTHRKEIQNSG